MSLWGGNFSFWWHFALQPVGSFNAVTYEQRLICFRKAFLFGLNCLFRFCALFLWNFDKGVIFVSKQSFKFFQKPLDKVFKKKYNATKILWKDKRWVWTQMLILPLLTRKLHALILSLLWWICTRLCADTLLFLPQIFRGWLNKIQSKVPKMHF